MLCAVVGLFACASAPALAAAPETPESVSPAKAVTATTATLEGVLNPGAKGEPGSYQFSYAPSATECTAEGAMLDPASPELAMGAEKEAKSLTVTGLEPNQEYAFCIIAYSLAAQPSQGIAVPFKTPAAKPSVASEAAPVGSTTATPEAQIDPNNESTTYVFEYSAKGKTGAGEKLEGAIVKLDGTTPLSGHGDQTATVPEIEKLSPGTSYFFRVVATNATGTTDAPVKEFATVPTPHTEAVTAVTTTTTATFHGTLTALNARAPTEYSFDYNTIGICMRGDETPHHSADSTTVSEVVTGLQPNTTYSVCLVSSNAFGSEIDATEPQVRFTTSPVAPTIESETSSATAEAATLTATVDPNYEQATCKFEYATSEAAVEKGEGKPQSCTDPVAGEGAGSTGSVNLAGLVPKTAYYYRVTATNATGASTDPTIESFETLSATAPVITNESAATVEETAATLEADIAPGGVATTYRFEYVTEAQFKSAGESFAGATTVAGPKTVSGEATAEHVAATVTGLQPGTPYEYRAVATNRCEAGKQCATDGEGKAFTTSPAPGTKTAEDCPNAQLRAEQPFGLTLPDCRAYELVSPVDTIGQDATESFLPNSSRAAPSGEALTFASQGSFANPTGAVEESQYLSRRGPEGWSTQAITPLHELGQAGSAEGSYGAMDFTPDLTRGIADTSAVLTAEAPKGIETGLLYLTKFGDTTEGSSYRYVGTGGEAGGGLMGVSTELNHVVFGEEGTVSEWANGKVTPVDVANDGAVIPASVGTAKYGQFYLHKNVWHAVSSSGSRVYFTSPANLEEGDSQLYVRENTEQEQSKVTGTGAREHCIEPEMACTIEVSASQKTDGSGPGGVDPDQGTARYWGASADGARVFFTSSQELTNVADTGISDRQEVVVSNATGGTYTLTFKGQTTAPIAYDASTEEVQTALEALSSIGAGNLVVSQGPQADVVTFVGVLAGSEQPSMSADGASLVAGGTVSVSVLARPGEDLYEYDLESGELADLTVDDAGDGADVQGLVQISEDGSYVYFVATGALKGAGGATLKNAQGEEPRASEPNLYVSHEGGMLTFIGTLAPNDKSDWDYGGNEPELESSPEINSAVVTPDGSRLAFMSERALTRYDNTQSQPGECEGEIIGRNSERETGSCREVFLYDAGSDSHPPTLACASCNPTGARPVGPASFGQPYRSISQYRARNFTEEGTLFFDSADALALHAGGGVQNVYEYEGGHIYPISDVAGGYESFFLDASADGSDVFFATADRLTEQDHGTRVAIYDARVGGGFPAATPARLCDNAESCRQPESPQPAIFGSPSSATFSGPGDLAPTVTAVATPKKTAAQLKAEKLAKTLKQCRQDKNKAKRERCEASARKRYGAAKVNKTKKAKKATNNRRADR